MVIKNITTYSSRKDFNREYSTTIKSIKSLTSFIQPMSIRENFSLNTFLFLWGAELSEAFQLNMEKVFNGKYF